MRSSESETHAAEEGGGVFSDVRKKNYNRERKVFLKHFFKRKKNHDFQQKEGNISFGIGFHSEKKSVLLFFFKRMVFLCTKNRVPTPPTFCVWNVFFSSTGCFFLVATFSEILRKNHPNLSRSRAPNVQVADPQKKGL